MKTRQSVKCFPVSALSRVNKPRLGTLPARRKQFIETQTRRSSCATELILHGSAVMSPHTAAKVGPSFFFVEFFFGLIPCMIPTFCRPTSDVSGDNPKQSRNIRGHKESIRCHT